ncbi:MAG: energy transducer TonB [Paludibacter sp.]|nr:energy transducer TonB [Paludibacter sp.]
MFKSILQNKFLLTLLLVCFLTQLHAQKSQKFYDYRMQECDRQSARFLSIVAKVDSVYCKKIYYVRERKLQMLGYFKDSLLQIKNGKFHYYHSNGFPATFGRYVNGKREGLWYAYHDNRVMSDSIVYKNDEQTGISLSWYPNGQLSDSVYTNEDGSGTCISWFDNGTLSSKGQYSKGHKQHGLWKYYHRNGKISAEETFFESYLTDKKYYDENGVQLAEGVNNDRVATFPSGDKGWHKYIDNHIFFPPDYRIINGDAATIVVSFTVNEQGIVENVYASTGFDKNFDDIAIDAIKKSPRWLPAIEHNRRVKFKSTVTVSFHQIEW